MNHQQWLIEAKEMEQQLIENRRYLHAHAEVGLQLPQTFAYVWDRLTDLGYQPKKCGQCGIVACIGKGSPVFMLRADMDALPTREESGLDFACQTGNGHLCGHDMHTAMLLGAAALLKRHEDELKGTVKLMFQPAEEPLAGASDMIANGLLEDPKPDAAAMIHVMNMNGVAPGTVIIAPVGVSAPAADMFEIRIYGKGCHGAMPDTGVDPINVGAHLVLALQAISTREMGLNRQHALTIGSFQAGETSNVIPDSAILRGSVRSFDVETEKELKRRIEEITKLTAETFRARAEFIPLEGCPTLINAEELALHAASALPQVIGQDKVIRTEQLGGNNARSTGSEDFSYISQAVPSLMMALSASGKSTEPTHHPKIIFNEEALPYGAAVYASMAFTWLEKANH